MQMICYRVLLIGCLSFTVQVVCLLLCIINVTWTKLLPWLPKTCAVIVAASCKKHCQQIDYDMTLCRHTVQMFVS